MKNRYEPGLNSPELPRDYGLEIRTHHKLS